MWSGHTLPPGTYAVSFFFGVREDERGVNSRMQLQFLTLGGFFFEKSS